jgi:hypothetical protein
MSTLEPDLDRLPATGAPGLRPATAGEARPAAAERRPKLMRQVDLIDRVSRYNPDTDEALLNRA